ncbi:MAG TPA: adenosine kinase [Cyclobacteriaceae bacterium]|nr:adenosine kinase [Cyclobacteriaceae bacterium]
MASVLGIGNALVDIIIRINDENLLRNLSLPKGSMTMIDAGKAETILQETRHIGNQMSQGGAVANTISGMANLGMLTGYLGKIGNDELGRVFRKDLEEVHTNPHLFYGGSPTGRAITLVTPDGERTFGTYLGSAVEMTPDEIDRSVFGKYEWLVAEGYLIFNRDLILAALTAAKEAGLRIAMDMASYNLVENNRDFILALLEDYIDVVFANELEAAALTGHKNPEDAVIRLGKICPVAVVKVGAEGSWIIRDKATCKVEAIRANCIDTTGAGDLYAAGFLYGLINGFSPEKSGNIGSLLGGNAVEVIGARLNDERWRKIKKAVTDQ